MATVDELRLKILDRPQVVIDERVGVGDGSRTVYKIGHSPIVEGSEVIRVDGEQSVSGEDYELDCSTGRLTFMEAPGEGEAVVASYEFVAFTDSELQHFLDSSGGNLSLAAGEAIHALVADRTKLVTWSRGSTKIDYNQLRADLIEMAKRFINQGRSEIGGAVIDEIDWEEIV
ncbi:MAG TPA: hypothetical protein ENN67_04670 [Firmicutes bacterium]|nr:hypothetical protein [Bacillota bacterium]